MTKNLNKIEAELKAFKKAHNKQPSENSNLSGGLMGMSIDMIAGFLVGAVIGYFGDQYFATKPWLMLIFCILGMVAGFKNFYSGLMKKLKDEGDNE